MNVVKPLSATLAAALLAACATDVDRLQTVEATEGTDFTRASTDEYRELAVRQGQELDVWSNAYHSADKGLRASEGELVMPDIPVEHGEPKNERCIMDEDTRAELALARERLLSVLDDNARESYPREAARAQARYDCWIAEEEFGEHDTVIAECRNDFMTLVGDLEERMRPEPEPELEPAPEPEPEPEPEVVAPEQFTVHFGFDEATIPADQMAEIDTAARAALDDMNVRIRVIGHTDAAGPAEYNMRLSQRRAENVRDALIARGVEEGRITIDSRGQQDLVVPTEEDVSEAANRRVEIVLE